MNPKSLDKNKTKPKTNKSGLIKDKHAISGLTNKAEWLQAEKEK